MPDQDRFARGFAPGWANPARKISCGTNPEIAAQATAKALRKDLEMLNGFQDLPELHDIFRNSLSDNKREISLQLINQLRSYEQKSQYREIANHITKAFQQVYFEYLNKSRSDSDLEFPASTKKQLLKQICENYINYQLHGWVEFCVNPEQNSSWFEPGYRNIYNQKLDKYIGLIADSLIQDPGFSKPPVFPRLSTQYKSNEELLNTPIEEL